MKEIVALQAVIGTDKKNPVLSLLREKDTNRYQVYYGCHLLEIIQDDPDHIGYRSAVARLYNAGLNRRVLSEVFGHDWRTIRSWGKALINEDAQEASRILSGHRNRKFTAEIEAFARSRFFSIYKKNRYNYSQQIRKEIEEVFGKSVSAEVLRPYFTQWKKQLREGLQAELESSPEVATAATPEIPDDSDDAKEQHPCDCPEDANDIISFNPTSYVTSSEADNRNEHVLIAAKPQLVFHIGIVLFAQFFKQLEEMFETGSSIIKQWFAMILLEAVNIEQSKYLHFASLNLILGSTVRRPYEQRLELNSIANEANCHKIFELNAQLCECKDMTDFYYDPHSKHYTGMAKILKGWCSSIGHADKVLHSDFIHSTTGQPLYFKHVDNYDDLRQRYKGVVQEFRSCCGIESTRCITMVIDRGIFSFETFEEIVDDATLELITWDKNFKPSQEPWLKYESHRFTMKRYRNNSHDEQIYTFQYIDMPWEKDTRIRRIAVKATNPRGKTIELGILATDKSREAIEIIQLIFCRWLQENDFKYLEKHYGFKQVISYDTIDYKELKPLLEDKQMVAGTYKALTYEKKIVETKIKNILFKQHNAKEQIAAAKNRSEAIDQELADLIMSEVTVENQEKMHTLRSEKKQLEIKLCKSDTTSWDVKLKACYNDLKQITEKINTSEKNVSKLDTLISQHYVRLDTRKKYFIDTLKMYARNAFYKILDSFKVKYDNFRDDHEYFRNLTHAHGTMCKTAQTVEVYLIPTAYLQPRIIKIFNEVLDELNRSKLDALDGSGKKLHIYLKPVNDCKDTIGFAI